MEFRSEYNRRFIVKPSCSSKLYWENRSSRQELRRRESGHDAACLMWSDSSSESSDEEFDHLCETGVRPLAPPPHVRKYHKLKQRHDKRESKGQECHTNRDDSKTANVAVQTSREPLSDIGGENIPSVSPLPDTLSARSPFANYGAGARNCDIGHLKTFNVKASLDGIKGAAQPHNATERPHKHTQLPSQHLSAAADVTHKVTSPRPQRVKVLSPHKMPADQQVNGDSRQVSPGRQPQVTAGREQQKLHGRPATDTCPCTAHWQTEYTAKFVKHDVAERHQHSHPTGDSIVGQPDVGQRDIINRHRNLRGADQHLVQRDTVRHRVGQQDSVYRAVGQRGTVHGEREVNQRDPVHGEVGRRGSRRQVSVERSDASSESDSDTDRATTGPRYMPH